MNITPATIEESGPGIDLSNQPEGLAVEMSDPVPDLEYARNAVTLTFDLSGFEHVRLVFEALEYGDEPHLPPPGPFGDKMVSFPPSFDNYRGELRCRSTVSFRRIAISL
ncbi:MAG: hypothetical protein NTZ09_21885 [Candidatus Hydrogenedentes bacterium]|nr:hypothetical protein [Candidatus Hydrogenedentota bacterium]